MEDRSLKMRTPHTAALEVLGMVLFLDLELNPGKTEKEFFSEFRRLWDDGVVSGDELFVVWTEGRYLEQFPQAIKMCMAFCRQALEAFREGRNDEAWAYAFDAATWTGITVAKAQNVLSPKQINGLSENARKAALARHAENNDIANQIMEWFKLNHSTYSSLDNAAEAAQKVVPTSFRTARKWVGEANKKYALHAGRAARKQK